MRIDTFRKLQYFRLFQITIKFTVAYFQMKTALSAIAVLTMLLYACSPTKPQQMDTDTLRPVSEPLTLAKGNYAPFQPHDGEPVFQLVIQSPEAYEELSAQFLQGGFGESLPEIDFRSQMVIGVWMGESSSSGYEIEIVGYEVTEQSFQIWVRTKFPDPSCAYLTVITSPFHIAALPQTDLPVTFLFNRVMNSCD